MGIVIRSVATCLATLVLALSAGAPPAGATCDLFDHPELVEIAGYLDVAMEPFVTPDGRYLLFNNSNAPDDQTDLHYAQGSGNAFVYRGKLHGANSSDLDGVPSVSSDGVLYFVSPRNYGQGFSVIHRGIFSAGDVRDVELVGGISRGLPGFVNFDAEISRDGLTLAFVDGALVPGAPAPFHADLVFARREGAGFARLSNSDEILRNVNTTALEYAPALSADGLELFFTRFVFVPGSQPENYRSSRSDASEAFGPPELLAFPGFAEAPALSPDGQWVYFHARSSSGEPFRIYRARRCST